MTIEEKEQLRNRIEQNGATVEECMRFYHACMGVNEIIPPKLEQAMLWTVLKANPTDIGAAQRLRSLLLQAGVKVPTSIESLIQQETRRAEYECDHQKAAASYDLASECRDMGDDFLIIYEKIRQYSMTSIQRLYALHQAVRYVVEQDIPGDIVECGVWRGGSMMMVAETLIQLNVDCRELYLFDTFEGLPRPDPDVDNDLWGNRAIDGWEPLSCGENASHWAEAGMAEVEMNLKSTGYPVQRIHLVKGLVEESVPLNAPDLIAVLRLDTDWYASTKHEMEHLYDRISPGGILIIDDYGHFRGARQAVDEFLESRGLTLLLNRVDYTGRLAVKPG